MTKDTTLLVATVKNEGANILEWVAHHRLCGFDRIQIYQNDSTDTTVRSLRVLDRLGIIEFYQNAHKQGAFQARAYRRAARSEAYAASDWCMTLDGDEFLNVRVGDGKVTDLINACPDAADAIMVNWRVFGSAGQKRINTDLITKRFVRAEVEDRVATRVTPYKTLARTASYKRPGIHLPHDPLKEDPVLCNGSGLLAHEFERKNWRGTDPAVRKFAQVNHYMLRDLSSFLLKHIRGSANAPHRKIDLKYWRHFDRNEEEDTSLAQNSDAVWAEMERLNELSGGRLLKLRQKALRQNRQEVRELLKDPEIAAMRDSILEVANQPMTKPFALPRGKPVFASSRISNDEEPLILTQKAAV